MPFTDEEKKEFNEHLGIAEGKTLAETISELIDGTLNGYDKRTKKELDAKLEALALPEGLADKITAALEKLEEGGGGDDDDDKDVDLSKLPAGVRAVIENLTKANKTLESKFEASETARAEANKKVKEEGLAAAVRAMDDAIVAAATAKDFGGLDASKMRLLLPFIKNEGLVRVKEGSDGVYEMNTGETDRISGDPIYKLLPEAMKVFAGTETGKTFRAARPGPGTPGTPGSDTAPAGDMVSIASLGGDAAKIREYADKGLIDYSATE